VPFYAATLARARLQKAQARLAERLRDPELRADAWPEPRVLLLLKLFATVFPASGEERGTGVLACRNAASLASACNAAMDAGPWPAAQGGARGCARRRVAAAASLIMSLLVRAAERC
jgi:hypothetical protein